LIEWWQSLVAESKIFYAIGIVSLVLLLFQMLMTILGLGGDHDHELGGHGDHEHGWGLITVRTVMAFLSGFGWAGGILLNRGYEVGPAIFRAVVVGALFLLATAVLVRNLLKLESSGNLDYKNAIGTVGTVYSTIPSAEAGNGQLELMMQGRLITAVARTQSSPDLKPGTQARVVALIGQSTLLVEPLSLP
jgi:membrane protein implicated in regulation of membrane protease activity